MPGALVTGASGFIGAPIVRALSRQGMEVHAVARTQSGNGPAGTRWHLSDLLRDDPAGLIDAVRPQLVIHLAWETTHDRFWDSPANRHWVLSTLRLAEGFAASGGSRFIGMGSCAEYSWTPLSPGQPLRESSPREPSTLYGASKNEAYEALSRIFDKTDVSFAWGRLFLPYGPGDRRPALISSLIRALLAGRSAPSTAGTQIRDFVYIDDIVRAVLALVNTPACGAFNIASGTGTSVGDVARRIVAETGRPDLWRPGVLPQRESEPAWLVGCPDKLTETTGWSPQVLIEEGIRETVRWWSNQ